MTAISSTRRHLIIVGLFTCLIGVCSKEYCKPSDSCWPTSDELEEFSKDLSGNVIILISPQYANASLINNRRFIEHPGMILNEEDVVLSLKFASKHKIRVSIVSTGHDYDGRNSGNDTLQLSFRKMKRKSIVEYGDEKITAIRVETGNTWADVHSYVKENMPSKVAIGGFDPSVGVAGWALGGGHSPFSSMAGLGVDNALEFDIVLANGSIVTANGDQNTELFWALRGGGGGTFGVVTNITFRLHDNPGPIQQLLQYYPLDKTTGLPSLKAIGKWLSTASSNVSGYLLLGAIPYMPSSMYIALLVIYRGSYEDAVKEAEPLMKLPYISQTGKNFSDAYGFLDEVPSYLGGNSTYTFNAFLSDESLAAGNSLSIAYSFVSSKLQQVKIISTFHGCTGTILGGAVATAVESSGATAVHPGFRKARMSLTCSITWTSPGSYSPGEKSADDWAAKLYKYGDGSYLNEPQSNLESWKNEFWGSDHMYNRLLKVKNEVDPEFLFNCHHCVGYED